MTRSILSLNPVSSRFERADRSHARRSQATHGPTRARGPRYNGATRAVLRPPTVQTRARGPRYKDPCSGYRFRGRRATGYNRTMSETAAGRVGVVVLLVLLAAVVVVPSLPGDPGAVRLAGVGVLWWFVACAAPLVATLTTCAFLRVPTSRSNARTATLRAVATWASPVVLTAVAARVFSGAPEAPVLVLSVTLAPLLALLTPSADPTPSPNRVAGLAAAAAVGLVLCANLGVVADVARLAGVPRHAALTLSAAAAFLGVGWRAARRPGGAVILAGVVGVVLPLVVIGAAGAVPPWTAWSRTASRAALTFGE